MNRLVHEELVSLYEASAAAYHVLVGSPQPADVHVARGLIAIALSRVATLYRVVDGIPAPLRAKDLEPLFSQVAASLRGEQPGPDLAAIYIRRGALLNGIETLRQANLAFG